MPEHEDPIERVHLDGLVTLGGSEVRSKLGSFLNDLPSDDERAPWIREAISQIDSGETSPDAER